MNIVRKNIIYIFVICFISTFNVKAVERTVPKKLIHEKMRSFNVLLSIKPSVTVRMKCASIAAEKVIDKINSFYDKKRNMLGEHAVARDLVKDDKEKLKSVNEKIKEEIDLNEKKSKELLIEGIDLILAPIDEFLDVIRSVRDTVKPLVIESLGSGENSTTAPVFVRFFDAPESEAFVFFRKNISSLDDLKIAASGFKLFFSDVWESLSDKAKEAYNKLVESI
jgi:hypothetical protein